MQYYKIIPDGSEHELLDTTTEAQLVDYVYVKGKALTPDYLPVTSYIQAEVKFNYLALESDVWVIQLSPNTSESIYVLPDLAVPSIDNIRTLMPETSIIWARAYELIRDFKDNKSYYLIPAGADQEIQDSTVTTLAKDNRWSFSATYGEPNYWKNTLEYTEGATYPFLGWHTGLFLLEVVGGTIDFAANGVTKSETNQKDAGRYLITTKDPTTERTVKWGDEWINKVDEIKNFVIVKGKLGDVIMVDIAALVYAQLDKKTLENIGLVDLKKATIESGTLDPKDTVYQDGTWEKDGKFYFHPKLSGTPYAEDHSHDRDPGLDGGSLNITDGDTKLIVKFEITDGFSGKNSENAVKWNTTNPDELNKLRIEQRLSYFGYPDNEGEALTVDGKGDDLAWAGRLFSSAAKGLEKNITGSLNQVLTPIGRAFINADNAPKWTEVAGESDTRPFKVSGGENQLERWGTSWAVDWLKDAAEKSSGYDEVLTALSVRQGGEATNASGKKSHKGHHTGTGIDIDTPGDEVGEKGVPVHGRAFFKEVELESELESSTWVLAADRAGEKVWVETAGTYVAKPKEDVLSSDNYIETNAITEKKLNLWDEENLLWDNSSVGYNHETIEKLITDYLALSVNGVKAKVVYFDDPRIYKHVEHVEFKQSHFGHLHVQISPPTVNAAHAASLLPADVGNIDGNLTATSLPEATVPSMAALGSLGAVQDLGLAPAAAIAGSIDSDNPDRYYGFSLSGLNPAFSGDEVGYYELPRVLTVGLTNTSANLDFEVGMDDNNDGILQTDEIIFVSTGTSSTSEELTTPFALDEGAYLVHIHAASGNANSGFTLNVNLQALSGSPVDSVGNTPASAKALVLGPLSTQVSEYLSPEDRADYYRITVTEPSHLGLIFHGLQDGNAVSTLAIDANGDGIIQDEEIIDGSITESGETTKLDQDLFQPGTYLLAMEQYSGATAYTMDALLDPLNIGTDTAGDTPETARDLGSLPAKLKVSETVGTPTDSMDVFKFAISQATDLRIILNSSSSSGDVAFLHDVGGDGFIGEEDLLYQTDVTSEAAIKQLDISGVKAGIYYLQVLGNSLMRYDLSIDPTVTNDTTYNLVANAANCNEGSSAIFTLTTTGVANGTVLPYVLSGTGITAADVTGGALTGNVTVNDNAATITVALASDLKTEGVEMLTVSISGTSATASTSIADTSIAPSYTVPGTLGNDFLIPSAGNNYLGGGGNDTYVISSNTLSGSVTAKITDTEGNNVIQLVDGMTISASSFYGNAAQLTLASGAIVQILGASALGYQVGANAPAGDTAATQTYSQFASTLGASVPTGSTPVSGTAGYVVPTGFTQAPAFAPALAGPSSTVPGTLGNDFFIPSAGNNYLGGGGNDTYVISPMTLSGSVTAKITDTEGSNIIQFVDGMTLTASSFYNDAAQLTLSTGAKVQILGASRFNFQLGANAPAGDMATSQSYAQFASTLGVTLPASGAAPVSGTPNFVVPSSSSAFTVVDLSSGTVTATAAAEEFRYDFQLLGGRVTKAGDGEVTINGFDVVKDKLVFVNTTHQTAYTEAEFKALPGVLIAGDPFSNNTLIYLDPASGASGGVTLTGFSDASLSLIVVETM